MNSFVGTVERKLGCSRLEARWRMGGLFLLPVAAIALIVAVLFFFPYQGEKTEHVSILPGDHEFLDGEVLVGKDRFLELAAEGNKTFITLEDQVISYTVKADDTPYRYTQSVHLDDRYEVHAQEIRDGTVVRVLHRDTSFMWLIFIVVPGIVLAALLYGLYLMTRKDHGTLNNPYRSLFGKA